MGSMKLKLVLSFEPNSLIYKFLFLSLQILKLVTFVSLFDFLHVSVDVDRKSLKNNHERFLSTLNCYQKIGRKGGTDHRGAGGIGSCTAKLFCEQGAKVVMADVQDEKGHSICNDIGTTHASFVHCDVTNEIHVQTAIDNAVAKHGKLDIMFNNAGIMDSRRSSILQNDIAEFENVVRVNLIGAFLGTKHAARVMQPARRGSIVNTASVSSVLGGLTTHAYASSKHGLLGLTRNTAVELGKFGIRVNCVSPYVVPTAMPRKLFNLEDDDPLDNLYSNLSGVALKPEDVAQAVLYLASDESKYVSGHNLMVDGGYTIVNEGLTIF